MVKIIHLVMVNFRKPQQSGQGMVLGWQNQIKNDWYETVKVNYGIRPDGSKDFPELPAGYDTKSYKVHFEFWRTKNVPSS
jgi:hypothetical protein